MIKSVLSDILDGYFPYDLKVKYPEGVPLKPVDMTDDTYTDQTKVSNIISQNSYRIIQNSKYLET